MSRTIVHFGPDTRDPGGMARVIQSYLELQLADWHIEAVSSFTARSRPRQLARLAAALAILAFRPRRRLDGIHIHSSERFDLLRTIMLLQLARRRGLTSVVTLHGANFMDDVDRSPRLVRAMLRRADAITVLSPEIEAAALRLGATNVKLLPNPVRLDSPATGGPPGRQVLFAGEIGRRKGVDVLLEAWRRVGPAHPDATLLLVGPPTEPDLLDDLPPAARYGGLLDRAQVREETRRAYLAVLPSRAEAMPMFILEAMAAGVPVVSTTVGAIPWVLEEGGLVVEAGDAETLTAGLDDLLRRPERREELGRAARARIGSHFSTDVFARRVDELYRSTFR